MAITTEDVSTATFTCYVFNYLLVLIITHFFIYGQKENSEEGQEGFGFVTFAKEEDAQKALDMNGKDVEGRTIVVNVAKPKEERGGGGYRRDNRR